MLKRVLSRSIRRSESGQSLVIIALGFVGLLAFVGIVTDVSLMFVRFSQLTRAVDSASIAAAGQVRRTAPNAAELQEAGCAAHINPDNMYEFYNDESCVQEAINVSFARSFANVGVAARQFIEFYGLSPTQVLVDMCATVSMVDTATGDLVPITEDLRDDFEDLCTEDQRKLIRVTAQIESPTVFLSLLGWGNILLQTSSVSETAVLDVVLIMDVSESLVNRTTYKHWEEAGYPFVYMPRAADQGAWGMPGGIGEDAPSVNPAFADLGTFWQDMVQDAGGTPGNAQVEMFNLMHNAFDAGNTNSPYYYYELPYPYPRNGVAVNQPREECRVAFFPGSLQTTIPNRSLPGDDSANLIQTWADAGGTYVGTARYGGFIPTYNFYGCCNDPNGDAFTGGSGGFQDLICQPFKEARDATERFLHRIDFFRGDRVSFVTFDRRAFIMYVDPDGAGSSPITHMIESEGLAIDTLQRYVGVRAEPTFYQPSSTPNYDDTEVGVMPWVGYSDLQGDHDYPVYSSCPFYDALLPAPFSAVSGTSPIRSPDALRAGMYPRGAAWASASSYNSYDLYASCGGGNIGAALREANDALLRQRTRRTEGAVWIMVMISDGAAGVSDPVRNGGNTIPDPIDYPYTREGFQVTYGGFGLCPAGTGPSSGAMDRPDLGDIGESPRSFPFCSDELPETRHFCFDPAEVTPNEMDVASFAGCEYNYDVDDYARDWADFVTGIRDINADASAGLSQLPTIFTIGFGFNFDYGTIQCKNPAWGTGIQFGANVGQSDLDDCLGEELLRYVADVGDNFTLDSDYQQVHRNGGPYPTDGDYGVRGPCELDVIGDRSTMTMQELVQPVQAGLSCGNYFNAPDEEQLDEVFDEIASRMFTRLTR